MTSVLKAQLTFDPLLIFNLLLCGGIWSVQLHQESSTKESLLITFCLYGRCHTTQTHSRVSRVENTEMSHLW